MIITFEVTDLIEDPQELLERIAGAFARVATPTDSLQGRIVGVTP